MLSDPQKRRRYDAGEDDDEGPDLSDIFGRGFPAGFSFGGPGGFGGGGFGGTGKRVPVCNDGLVGVGWKANGYSVIVVR